MERYSSNLTLFYVIFLPVFSWTFLIFGVVGVFVGPIVNDDIYNSIYIKMAFVVLLVIISIINIFFSLRLKRIEADNDRIYISNYFKHTTMSLDNIKSIRISDLWVMRIVHVRFHNKSIWGQSVLVLERENLLEKFCQAHGITVES